MIAGETLLAAVILAIDLSLPLGVAGGVPYVALVCLGWYGRGARQIVVLGVVASLLTVAGYYFSPDGGTAWVVLANRFLAFAAIWVTAAFLIVAKRAGERVAISQKRIVELARFPDENPNPVLRVGSTGTIHYANPAASEVAELFAGDGQDTLAGGLPKEMAQALETGSLREVDFVAGDRTLAIVITPVAGVSYVNLYGRDVTQRKKAEAALQKANETLEQRVKERTSELEKENAEREAAVQALRENQIVLANAQRLAKIGNWHWSIEHNELISCSEEYSRIHGVSMDEVQELMKEQMARVIHPEDRHRVATEFKRADEGGVDYEIDYRIVHRDGKARHVLEIGETIRDASGRAVEQVGTVQDITERKLAEEALVRSAEDLKIAHAAADTASRAKSEFLASMSHELRTPLNAIIGFSEIMSTETLGPIGSPKYRDYAGDIHDSGQHLLDLINDILDLSKIESGNEELYEEDVVVPDLTNSALRLVVQRAEQHGVRVELNQPDDLPALHADTRKLKQILVNLLSNAIKFTKPGGTVMLKTWCRADSGHVFQVIDTGIGIAREDIPKALSQFGQIDSSASREHVGTGLGLPLTKSLAELHGGSLDLQSEIGVGTTVTVRFPAERIVDSPAKKAPCSAA